MGNDGLLRIVAAGAAASGVFALVTGSTVSAAGAGLCSVFAAVLVGRTRPGPDTPPLVAATGAPVESIDIREPDESSSSTTTIGPAAETETGIGAETETGIGVEPEVDVVRADDGDLRPTGSPQLYDGDYLAQAIRGRIAVARRALRPLSVVHVQIIADETHGGPVPAELIAAAAEATLRESDIVGRRDDGVYVVVLEDTGEDGAVWTAERLRRHIAGTIGPQRFQAGVASYPNHGLDAETVDASAARALDAAREWDRDRIEVALH